MFISFSCEKSFLYIILFSPLYFFRRYLNQIINDKNLQTLIDAFSKFLLIIFYIIEKKKSKINKDIYKKGRFFTKSIENKKLKKIHSIIKKILILCSNIFDIISLYLKDKCKLINYTKCTDVILFILIDIICFKTTFYSHQIISIDILIILLIILVIMNLNKFINIQSFILILLSYGYGFSRLTIQFINIRYFISIYLLGSFVGIFQSIFHTINIFFILQKTIIIDYNKLLFMILYLIICLLINYLYFYIILILSPIHSLICYNFSYIINDLIKKNEFFIDIFLLEIIPLISTLIYLEIIEFNFCGLDKNLKKNIEKRVLENEKRESFNSLYEESSNCENELGDKKMKDQIQSDNEEVF